MRLRASVGLLCVTLAGCQHVPEGVKIDLQNRVVEVGRCRCQLPGGNEPVEPAPPAPAEAPADEPR